MIELSRAIPDADVVLDLEPEELGAKLLFLLRGRHDREHFHLGNMQLEIQNAPQSPGHPPIYPNRRQEIGLALAEAWAWLEAQGLIVPAEGMNGSNGWRRMSRRARSFESEVDFTRHAAARLLPKKELHPRISGTVWMAFMRGEFDVAVLHAMKAVEVAVREAAGLPARDIGTNLMRVAFDPQTGPLTDMEAERAEREARSALFAGAIGSYKNPHSHRDVPLDNPIEAMEVILLANHLLRIVDSRKAARACLVDEEREP